jgi:hypothetical protein
MMEMEVSCYPREIGVKWYDGDGGEIIRIALIRNVDTKR